MSKKQRCVQIIGSFSFLGLLFLARLGSTRAIKPGQSVNLTPTGTSMHDKAESLTTVNAGQIKEIALLGRGSIGKAVQWSPDGKLLAVSSSIGIWLYEPPLCRPPAGTDSKPNKPCNVQSRWETPRCWER